MPGDQQSLAEFVRNKPWRGGASAACCRIPRELLNEIEAYVHEVRERGDVPHWRAIAEWVHQRGHKLTKHQIVYHFERGHDAPS